MTALYASFALMFVGLCWHKLGQIFVEAVRIRQELEEMNRRAKQRELR